MRWRKNSRLPFGPGRPESTTPTTLAPQPSAAVGDLAQHARADCRVADDAALADVLAAGLELRLHEHDGLPARRGERSAGGSAIRTRDERHVADDELRRERELGERARVRPLEHDDARVVAQPLVQLPVADVDGDHARGAALQQDVGEAAGRGADVEAVEARRIDAERVERVRELLAAARDVRRGRARPSARRPRRPAGPACRSRARAPPSRAPAPARATRRGRARRGGRRAASSRGAIPQRPSNASPGSSRIRSSPVLNAFGGHVIGSTAIAAPLHVGPVAGEELHVLPGRVGPDRHVADLEPPVPRPRARRRCVPGPKSVVDVARAMYGWWPAPNGHARSPTFSAVVSDGEPVVAERVLDAQAQRERIAGLRVQQVLQHDPRLRRARPPASSPSARGHGSLTCFSARSARAGTSRRRTRTSRPAMRFGHGASTCPDASGAHLVDAVAASTPSP